jgi:hypothetical protein
MEDSTLPSVGASFKKWGCCRCTLPKEAQPLLHARALIFFVKKMVYLRLGAQPSYAHGKPVAPAADQWLPGGGSTSNRHLLTAGRRSLPGGSSIFATPYPLPSSLLSQNLLLFVNSSSLAPAHAHPAQTSLKNFKHP